MHQLIRQDIITGVKEPRLGWLPHALVLVSVTVGLVAIFGLTTWVEMSGWHHAVQHVLIFGSGLTAGGSVVIMKKIKKEN